MHKIFRLGIISIFCMTSLATNALDPAKSITQYLIDNWQHKEGLPQNTVTSIAQTSDGYLWLGTLEGLVRFDGVQFKLFNSRNSDVLTHNLIVTLATDSNGRLWIGTTGGGLFLRTRAGEFHKVELNNRDANQISLLYKDSQNTLWLGTQEHGLFKIINKDQITPVLIEGVGNSIRSLVNTVQGVWVASNSGLTLLNGTQVLQHFDTANGLMDNNVRALAADAQNNLWIGTDTGLQRLSSSFQFHNYQSFFDQSITSIKVDEQQNLWIATDGNGLARQLNNNFEFLTVEQGLADNSLLTLFNDNENNLWLGSNLGGLIRLKDGVVTTYSENEGLTSNTIRSVYQDSSQTIWVGTEGAGLNQFVNNRKVAFNEHPQLANSKILSMLEDSRGVFWLGTEKGLFSIADDKLTRYSVANGLTSNIILSLYEDSQQRLWIGTYAGGVSILEGDRFKKITTQQGLTNNTVNVILEDKQGAIWLGTRGGGLNRYYQGKITSFTTKQGLSDDMVFALYQDQHEALWIGTYGGGLNRLKNSEIKVITEANGLYDNVIHRIIEDKQQTLWMTSNRGIFNASLNDLNAVADGRILQLESTHFGVDDGMLNAECNGGANAGMLDHRGQLWFPTVNGVVKISSDFLAHKKVAAPTIIEQVTINKLSFSPDEPILFSADQKAIEILYTSPTLAAAEKLLFKFQLKGFDEDWNIVSRRTAYYSQLPAGNYEFQVTAATPYGEWSQPIATIKLEVKPHYYQTPAFIISCIFIISLSIFIVHRLRIARLKRQNLKLEKLVVERTRALMDANQKLARLAEEDGLTGVYNRRFFDERLDQECRRAERTLSDLSLLLIDIDFFKGFNDQLGHQAGDQCIKQVTRIVSAACIRAGDAVCRYGGDELAVILPGINATEALNHAETIRKEVVELKISHPASAVSQYVTLSIGVATHTAENHLSAAALVRVADQSLYRVKQLGRNQVGNQPTKEPQDTNR